MRLSDLCRLQALRQVHTLHVQDMTTITVCRYLKLSLCYPFRRIYLTLDDDTSSQVLPSANSFDFSSYLYIGGVNSMTSLPWHAWSREHQFVGCLSELRIDGTPSDLANLRA